MGRPKLELLASNRVANFVMPFSITLNARHTHIKQMHTCIHRHTHAHAQTHPRTSTDKPTHIIQMQTHTHTSHRHTHTSHAQKHKVHKRTLQYLIQAFLQELKQLLQFGYFKLLFWGLWHTCLSELICSQCKERSIKICNHCHHW